MRDSTWPVLFSVADFSIFEAEIPKAHFFVENAGLGPDHLYWRVPVQRRQQWTISIATDASFD